MAGNIFGEIFVWSRQLASWQNEAIRRLFTNPVLSTQEKEVIFKLAQVEHGLQPPLPKPPDLMLKPTELPTSPQPGQQIKLKAVRTPINVNALKSDQRLVIGDHLTVIYGENASGKSGYARMMKKAFRARAIDPILPNVYSSAPTKGPANAVFEIEENSKVRDEKWIDGTGSPECLGRFAVFDSKCARVYISENNQLSFLPYGFDIIDGLAAVTAEIKKRFQELATRSAPNPDALRLLVDQTLIGRIIGALTASTKEEDIKAKAAWSNDDMVALGTKESELAKLKASSPQALRDALKGRRRQIEAIRVATLFVAAAISESKLAAIRAKVGELMKYETAVDAAAKATFGNLDLPGVGSDVWRELLLAAERFSTTTAYPTHPFPTTVAGAQCVLCLQPLDAEAQQRLARFWQFIQDDISSKRDKARKALQNELEALKNLPRKLPREIDILEESLRAVGSNVFDKAKDFYTSAAARIAAMETAVASNAWNAISSEPTSPTEVCESELATIDKSLGEIVNDEKVNKAIATLTSEIAELKARKRLNENLTHVLDHLKALKISEAADAAGNKITTRAISLKADELQTKYVTEAFKKRVEEELKPVGLTRVRAGIDKKPEKGKVLHKVTVAGTTGASPELVFSEGERTAVSLACFLAELSASDDNCGIVFDDPVSSLDHRVREATVKRLVSEAGKRQVIIFTHDLVFYRELIAAADRQNVSVAFQNVEALDNTVGILTDIPPWPVQKVGQRVARLEQVLKKAKEAVAAANPTTYRAAFREFYDLLRSTWERSVEELLFNQVVQRLEIEVKTMSLDGVFVDNESVAAVFDGMTRTSAMIEAHDHAVAQNPPLPDLGQLKSDLEAFNAFVQKQKEKMKLAREQNAHLKK